MTDNKNLLLAVVISLLILFGFQAGYNYFFPKPPAPEQTEQADKTAATAPGTLAAPAGQGVGVQPPGAPGASVLSGAAAAPSVLSRADLVKRSGPRIRINTTRIHGSVALTGGRLDDITLAQYRETLDPNSPEIVLFSPLGAQDAYFAETGWVPVGGAIAVPGPDTVWTADGDELTDQKPLTLTWDNGSGLIFRRTITVDDYYMFTIRQSVENRGSAPVTLVPYSLVARFCEPPVSGYFILFEGPLGVFNGTLD